MKNNSDIDTDMPVNPFTLRFTGTYADYEPAFHKHYLLKSIKPLRFGIFLAVFTWGAFGFLDLALDPEHIKLLWLIRYGIVLPLMLIGLLVSYFSLFEKLMQPFISFAILVTGAAIITMIPIAAKPVTHTYYAGLILTFIFAYTILRLRLVWAIVACWPLVAGYEIMAVLINTPKAILISNSFFFIAADIYGIVACYFIELSSRRDFLLARLLKEEKEKVAQANQELEGNVRERTQQLIKINQDLNLTISGQQQAVEQLKKSEEKYRTIITNIKEGYYEIDLHGNFTFVNDSVVKIFNCDAKEDLLGANFRDYITEENIKETLWSLNEIYQSGIPISAMNWEVRQKNGSLLCSLEVSATVISGTEGEPIGFRGIIRDITERKEMERQLLESYENIKQTRTMTILGLAKLAEYRDQNTGEHLERIMEYTLILTQALKKNPKYKDYITDEYIEDVYISSMLHDIGKVGITDEILLKPGPLTAEEYEKVKEHAALGGNALSAVEEQVKGKSFLTIGKQICYYHHEKWNGTGYPSGLEGQDIPLSARIVALTDVYDTVTSDRVYKSAESHEAAVDIIKKERGAHFDPDVVDAFLTVQNNFKKILDSKAAN